MHRMLVILVVAGLLLVPDCLPGVQPDLAKVGTDGCIGSVDMGRGVLERHHAALNDDVLVYRLQRANIEVFEDFEYTIRVVDLKTGREREPLIDREERPGFRYLLTPDARTVIADYGTQIVAWDIASRTEVRRFAGIKGEVKMQGLSPDGRFLAANYSAIQGPGQPLRDHGLCLWEVATGKFLYSIESDPTSQYAIAFSRVAKPSPRPWLLRVGRLGSHTEESYTAYLWNLFETEAKSSFINYLALPHQRPHRQPIAVEARLEQLGGVPGFRACVGFGGQFLCIPPAPATALAARKNDDGTITLYDRWTDKEVKRLAAFPPKHLVYAWMTPNGQRVIGIGSEQVGEKKYKGRLFIWDTSKEHAELAKLRPEFTPDELKSLWTDLTNHDARVAQRAACLLARNPERTMAHLRERLTPVPWPEGWPGDRRFATTLAQLEDDRRAVREQAERLLHLHNISWTYLQNAVKTERLSPDAQRRMQPLLDELAEKTLTPTEHRRYLWSIELLERIATPEAKELLLRLARGHQSAWITWEAWYALGRLGVDTMVLRVVDGLLWPYVWGWPRF